MEGCREVRRARPAIVSQSSLDIRFDSGTHLAHETVSEAESAWRSGRRVTDPSKSVALPMLRLSGW